MINHSPLLAPAPARPTAQIAVLRCREKFTMNAAPLQILFGTLSDHEAEDIVCRFGYHIQEESKSDVIDKYLETEKTDQSQRLL